MLAIMQTEINTINEEKIGKHEVRTNRIEDQKNFVPNSVFMTYKYENEAKIEHQM